MTKRPTNAELQEKLDKVRSQRDAALGLAEKHIRTGNQLAIDLKTANDLLQFEEARHGNRIDDLNKQLERAHAKHQDLIRDAQTSLTLVTEIMAKPFMRPEPDFEDLPF